MTQARTLVERQPYPSAIAVDSEYVYWTCAAAGVVRRATKRGDNPITLAEDLGCPLSLALDDASVFVAICEEDGAILRLPKRGGELSVIAPGQVFPACLALDERRIYWTTLGDDRDNGQVLRVNKGGGDFAVLAEGQAAPDGIGVDATAAYWLTRDDYVCMSPMAGGAAVVLHHPHEIVEERLLMGEELGPELSVPQSGMVLAHRDTNPPAVRRLALDEGMVYWHAASGVIAAVSSRDAGRPAASPLLLAIDVHTPSDVAVDREWVYWIDHREGRVMRVARAGGRPRVFAEHEPGAIAIAVDEEMVYWAVTGTSPSYGDGEIRAKRKGPLTRAPRR